MDIEDDSVDQLRQFDSLTAEQQERLRTAVRMLIDYILSIMPSESNKPDNEHRRLSRDTDSEKPLSIEVLDSDG